jgi:dTDP-4-amino-4,6-dideoxygalactose transaminase
VTASSRDSLAEAGATAAFAPWPSYPEDERAAAEGVLVSGRVNYWTGTEARDFEREYAAEAGTRYAIALANGTVALELALLSYGIGPGDDVVTTPRTFIATASSVVMRGARPVFADVDRESQNITAATIEQALTPATKAIIVVHLAGWPCEMDEIMALARHRQLVVIEDCAQANGARYKGRAVGGLAHAGAFSFCQDKIITTAGEGGMLTLSDEEIWNRAWSFKDHGKSHDAVYRRQHAPGFRWVHESFGTNWRMTEIQAAIGRVQLRKLPGWMQARRRHASQLARAWADLSCLRIPAPPPHIEHANYKFYVFVENAALRAGWSRDRLMAEIQQAGIPCFAGSCSEIYREKAFEGSLARPGKRLAVASELGETSMMFLVHPTLEPEHIERTAAVVRRICLAASR